MQRKSTRKRTNEQTPPKPKVSVSVGQLGLEAEGTAALGFIVGAVAGIAVFAALASAATSEDRSRNLSSPANPHLTA